MSPTLYTQLNNGTRTAGADCATMTIMMAVAFGTGDRMVPSVKEIRQAAGNTSSGLKSSEVRKALAAFAERAAERGMKLDYIVPRIGTIDELREWLREGRFCGVAIDYRVINKQIPELSGQLSLTAMHSVGLHSFKSNGKTTMYDPLYDGRRRNVPLGPQDVPFSVIRDATGPYVSSAGHFWGYAVKAPERPTLRRGSSGPDVTYAQERLRAHGRTGVLVNGGFGWRTERGVRNFQALKSLPVNGVIEAATWRKLEEKP